MYCDRCGTPVDPTATFCSKCGAPQPVASPLPVAALPVGAINPNSGPGDWLAAGFNAVTSNFWLFVLLSIIYVAVSGTIPIILQGPLAMGLQWAALRQVVAKRATFNDLGIGFNLFGPALLICLLYSLIVWVAGLFLILPGLFAAAMLQFPYLLVLDRRMEPWAAIKESFRVSQNYLGRMLAFVLLQVCVVFVGLLLCGVGVLVAVPILFAATAAAYIDLFGLRAETRAAL